ncbi:MAG: amidohydrolase [Synergistaceae bacterium]|jgi:5-methylthioadenosine/S-adenosylhomocysteine deaminase|nr:amidohydrolase [Synergistaceae bacterium]
MGQIYIKNAFVVTMNETNQVFKNGGVLLEGDRIIAAGDVDETLLKPGAEVIRAGGKYVLPGLVNTHVHTSQQLGRGLGDDVNLLTWLHERIWPYESSMTAEDSYISTLLCCLEQVRAGVTSFAEPGGQFVSGMARAVKEIGLRAKLAKSVMDCGDGLPKKWRRSAKDELDKQESDLKKYHNTANGRIQVWFGLRTIFNNSDELITASKELADKYRTGLHMHVAEVKDEIDYAMEVHGEPTVTHLERLGVLDKNFLAVHTVWLTDKEVGMFKKRGVKVSHNPAAAMRVLGFAKIPLMYKEGICVTIGTDGAPSSNHMDMVDEMWLTSLIHKGWRLDPTVMKAQEILQMATKNGARALMDEHLYGSLEPGKKADLIIINPNSASMLPLHDPIANLVTAMHSSNIDSTMCDGRWLMRGRVIKTVDERAILKEAEQRAAAIRKRAGIRLPDRFPVTEL